MRFTLGYPVKPDQTLAKATTVLSQATLGATLGHNPDRPKQGDEGLADGFRVRYQLEAILSNLVTNACKSRLHLWVPRRSMLLA
eukprot:SAG31_NODE_3006_length_4794_cov_3.365495_4_plen_84_part_00